MIDEVPGLPSNASCDGEAKATVCQPLTVKEDTLVADSFMWGRQLQ